MANKRTNHRHEGHTINERKIVWTDRVTRAYGRGFVRDMGAMDYATARRLAFLYGAAFVSNRPAPVATH